MSQTVEDFPIPVNPVMRRLEAVDMLRGLLMILMAVDHSRDFFTSAYGFDPTDPMRSWPSLYATRRITHLCAPGFIALAGTSVYLQRKRGKTRGQMAKLLIIRGLWLIFLEITLISFGWSFAFAPGLQVIWAIGVSMVFLGLLQGLPTLPIGIIGAAIVGLHNLADGIKPASFGDGAIFWTLLHVQGPLILHHQFVGFVMYPVIPWIGVICLGYAFGSVVNLGPNHRQRLVTMLGVFFLFAFTAMRLMDSYGDRFKFEHLDTRAETAMSFFEVEKYPPSLQYLLGTLSVLLLMYALFDAAVSRNWLRGLRGFIEVYGRVPFFYYVLHIYMIHAIALVWTAHLHMNWRFWTVPGAVFIDHLNGWGYGLGGVYLVWAIVVSALYFPCLWFSRVKSRRRDWWLSYL